MMSMIAKSCAAVLVGAVALQVAAQPSTALEAVYSDIEFVFRPVAGVPSVPRLTTRGIQYLPIQSRIHVDSTLPLVCLPAADQSGIRLHFDRNTFNGGSTPFPGVSLGRLSYLPGPNAKTVLIEGRPGNNAICHLHTGQTNVSTASTPCDSQPVSQPSVVADATMPLFRTGFESLGDGIVVTWRQFERDATKSNFLRFRLDVHFDPTSTVRQPSILSIREWFPTNSSLFRSTVGVGGSFGAVAELKCTGYGPNGDVAAQARCNAGAAARNWLTGQPPHLIDLDRAYLPPGGCLRLEGMRELTPTPGVEFVRYGFGVFDRGGATATMSAWRIPPDAP